MIEFRRVALGTGVTLNVALGGAKSNAPLFLLHGFPESHRTWRKLAPQLADDFFLVMPDQRGFAGSDRPQEAEAYRTRHLVDDVFALADALDIERFSLVGHDWGGVVAWNAAMRRDPRLERLAIVNAPHPLLFQKSLIESKRQRAASQYINAFRMPGFEKLVQTKGFDWFFEQVFSDQVDPLMISLDEKREYIAEWSQPGAFKAMLNWYRSARIVVPPPGMTMPLPDWLLGLSSKIEIPTLVIWGMQDKALLPLQLCGLDALVEDLAIVRLPTAGHFAPWEAHEDVLAALQPFLAAPAAASADAK